MCGRYVATTPPDVLAAHFGATTAAGADALPPPRWNVAPTDPVPAVIEDRDGERRIGALRWGLLPSFVADPRTAATRINARGETVATSPSFRRAFARRRCLLPADGFYEWDADKQPWFISRADGLPLAMAGIWETWQGLGTCAVITAPAPLGDAVAPLHDRCPVVIDAADYDGWLDRAVPGDAVAGLVRPPAPELLVRRPANRRVNNVRNDGPDLLDPDTGRIDGPVPLRLL
ncbi:MAG TPA: SOS response-associated peptidase [Acidimicrobiales bacterium]|nr:SOS response-associated peptidase [Acidimicrobiales bacterium]